MANGLFGGGTGASGTPWLVEDAADLNAVRNSLGASYKQVSNIDLSGFAEWIPIGSIFSGVYDGGNYTVSNVICTGSYSYTGLFAGNSGNIINLGVENIDYVTSRSYVGGLVGRNISFGTISDCYATGNIIGGSYVSGLVGDNDNGIISNCYATVNVTGGDYVSGLVGDNNHDGIISNCYATGNVTGSAYVGGLVSSNNYSGTTNNCYATGDITGSSNVSGLVGYNSGSGTISNCYALNNYINRRAGQTATSFGDITGAGEVINCYSLDTMQFIQL